MASYHLNYFVWKKKSIHHWSFAIYVGFFLLKMRPANLQMQPVKTSLLTLLLTSWMNGWMLLGQKRLVVLIASNDRKWEVMGGSYVANVQAIARPLDLAFTASSMITRTLPRRRDVKEKQQKSIQCPVSVSVSLPPHRCETVHNADATRKFGSKDAV